MTVKHGKLMKVIAVALLVLFSLPFLTGCSSDDTAEEEPLQLSFATVGEGTGYYTFCIALSGIMEKYDKNIMITPLVVPGSMRFSRL